MDNIMIYYVYFKMENTLQNLIICF